jgi:hypothetical protein
MKNAAVNFVRDLASKPKSDLMPRKTFSENNNCEKSSLGWRKTI